MPRTLLEADGLRERPALLEDARLHEAAARLGYDVTQMGDRVRA